MILLIDSGNSRLKVGWLNPSPEAAPPHDTPNAPAIALPPREPAAIAFERGAGIREALARHHCPVHWISSRAQLLHLKNGYTQPSQLGTDRLVSLLGVRSRLTAVHPPFVLASFGTATTIDTVGPDDTFIGGLIFPGPALMRSSLARGTANLPLANGSVTDFPTDTHQAIASGIAAAQAGAVLRQWLAACQHYGQAAELYVAGGGWPEVEHETQRLLAQTGSTMGMAPTPRHLDRPVLDGLALLASQPDPRSL